ncbi:hypothetical protein PPH41_42005, partial [Burkholderia gladioli]|nr:hypothetical protein [Burkholderia gladioli]
MKKKAPVPRIEPYHHAAAGWGAVKQVAINLIKERVAGGNYRTLFRQNQPDGFDCPGCAWPDRLAHRGNPLARQVDAAPDHLVDLVGQVDLVPLVPPGPAEDGEVRDRQRAGHVFVPGQPGVEHRVE